MDVSILTTLGTGDDSGCEQGIAERVATKVLGHRCTEREDHLRVDLSGIATGVDGEPPAGGCLDVWTEPEVDQARDVEIGWSDRVTPLPHASTVANPYPVGTNLCSQCLTSRLLDPWIAWATDSDGLQVRL